MLPFLVKRPEYISRRGKKKKQPEAKKGKEKGEGDKKAKDGEKNKKEEL